MLGSEYLSIIPFKSDCIMVIAFNSSAICVNSGNLG